MLPVIGTGLDDVVAPFSRSWRSTLRDPSTVTFVYVDRDNADDEVGRTIGRDPDFLDGFDVAAEFGSVAIYRQDEGTGS